MLLESFTVGVNGRLQPTQITIFRKLVFEFDESVGRVPQDASKRFGRSIFGAFKSIMYDLDLVAEYSEIRKKLAILFGSIACNDVDLVVNLPCYIDNGDRIADRRITHPVPMEGNRLR